MDPRLFDIDTAILTNRTVIRRFRENDGAAFFNLVQDNSSYVQDYFPQLLEQVSSPEQSEQFIREKLAAWLLQQAFAFAIWDKQSTTMIGYFCLFDFNRSIHKAEISYFIDHKFSSQGIMTEVLEEVIKFAFEDLFLEKLVLRTTTENYPSQRLARKCGFSREGDLRAEFRRSSGEVMDIMLFGLTKPGL